jgi:hypothetical protein
MKRLFSAIACFCVYFSVSQDLSSSYKYDSVLLGKFYNQAELYAKTVQFNFPLFNTFHDTATNRLYITAREKDGSGKFYKNNGFQFALNCMSDSILWVNDVRKFDILPSQNHLIISSDVSSAKFNKSTGLEVVQYGGRMIYADDVSNVGLTIHQATSKKDEEAEIKLLNLDNSVELAKHKLSMANDLVELKKWGDSLLLISGSGIHGINLYTGEKWSIDDVTGEKVKDKLIQSIINPNAERVNQKSYLESTYQDVITQVCSNMLFSGDKLFYATKNFLYAFSKNGTVLWKIDLSNFPTSKSVLFIHKDKLYMLNLGVANFKDLQVVYGAPYLMQVDPQSGNMNFRNPLPMFNYPVDFKISGDLVLAGKNNLYFINISDGRFFNELDVNELRYGNFVEFVDGDAYYVEKEGYFVPLNFINDNVIYFKSSHGKVYGVEGGQIQYEYHESELYQYDTKLVGFRFIKQKFKSYILNTNFELVAVLDTQDPTFVIKDKLYYKSGRKLNILHGSNVRK